MTTRSRGWRAALWLVSSLWATSAVPRQVTNRWLRQAPIRAIAMSDTTIKKVEAASSPKEEMGLRYLVAGKRVSMRLCDLEPGREVKLSTRRDYETVGYVISGSARLELEGQTLLLKQGDSWLVPAGAVHWNAIEHFKAIEATSPPAQVHGRDAYGYVEES